MEAIMAFFIKLGWPGWAVASIAAVTGAFLALRPAFSWIADHLRFTDMVTEKRLQQFYADVMTRLDACEASHANCEKERGEDHKRIAIMEQALIAYGVSLKGMESD